MPALAYLLTFSTYGTHLPGSGKGWVDVWHCLPGSPALASNPAREAYWRAHLNEIPWKLDWEAQRITVEALRSVWIHRRWIAHAIHIRTNHVHAVVAAEIAPERILTAFKAYATRAFRRAYPDLHRRRYWTDHGSTRYLWNEVSFKAQGWLVIPKPERHGVAYAPWLGFRIVQRTQRSSSSRPEGGAV